MENINFIWAAGLIDGEGCICIKRQIVKASPTGRRSYMLSVSISMVHKPTILKMQSLFGGYVRIRKSIRANHRTAWEWSVLSREAKFVLESILSYSVTKLDEVVAGLKFANREMAKGGCRAIPSEGDIREAMYLQLRSMKRYEFFDEAS